MTMKVGIEVKDDGSKTLYLTNEAPGYFSFPVSMPDMTDEDLAAVVHGIADYFRDTYGEEFTKHLEK